MGYLCPVCEDPQADGEHLANHLAFTAMLGDGAHETWLDDHAPGWVESDPETLAERVVEHAERGEFPQVFEDTTGRESGDGDHGHHPAGEAGHTRGRGADAAGSGRGRESGGRDLPGDVEADVPDAESIPRDVLAEAREMTRERRESGDADAGGESSGATDGDPEAGGETGDGSET